MSGIFWEASLQPDLMESVSTFVSSSLALAMALPMFVLDLLCSLVISTAAILSLCLAPVIDTLGQVGLMAVSSVGLEDSWSTNHSLLLGLFLYTSVAILLSRGGGSNQQLFTQLTSFATGLLWIINFLIFPVFDTAQFAQVGLLSIGLQLAAMTVRSLFLEHSSYRHNYPASSLHDMANGILDCLSMEVMGAIIICAFGYPGSQGEEISSLYCILPFLAVQCIYFTSIHKVEAAPEVTANGYATEMKDDVAAVIETVATKMEEIQDICGDKVAEVKEKIEAEIVNAVDENPEILEVAARVEAVGQIAEEKIEEVVEAVKETVEAIGEIVEEKVAEIKEKLDEKVAEIKEKLDEKVVEVKADPMFQRIMAMLASLYTSIASRLTLLLSTLANMASSTATQLSSVPWLSILLLLSTSCSHLLHAAAWLHLTGSNLSLVLPLLTLALPLVLDTLAPRLPSSLPPYIQESGRLAVAGVTYLLITSGGGEA